MSPPSRARTAEPISVQPAALEALAAELSALAAELAEDADLCRSAAHTVPAALGDGARAGPPGTAPRRGPPSRRCWPTAPGRWAATLSAAVAALRGRGRLRCPPGSAPGAATARRAPGDRARGGAGRPRLAAVAAWDVPLLRGAVATLDAVAGRLPRLAGPAGRRGPVAGVGGVLDRARRPRRRSRVADELSAAAWAVDAAAGRGRWPPSSGWPRGGRPRPGARCAGARARPPPRRPCGSTGSRCRRPALTVGRRRAARTRPRSAAAADDAGGALAGLGVRDAFAPADLGRPGGRGRPARCRSCRRGVAPEEVAAWWAGLSATAQLAAIRRAPADVGRLDGVPAWARDRANRLVLDRALRGSADAAAGRGHRPRRGAPDPGGGGRRPAGAAAPARPGGRPGGPGARRPGHRRRGGAAGPGRGQHAGGRPGPADRRRPGRRHGPRGPAAPGLAVATVVWLGYRTPGIAARDGVAGAPARQGGRALAAGLAGLAAARTATGDAAAAHHRAGAQLRHGGRRRGRRRPRRAGRRRRRPAAAARAWRRTRAASRCRRCTTPRLGDDPISLAGLVRPLDRGPRLRVDRPAGRARTWGTRTTTTPDSPDPGRDRRGGRRRRASPD